MLSRRELDSALSTLNSALEWLDSLQGSGIRPGLGRIRALLRGLGRPQRAYPSIIVAGTNGKGSTSAMLASIFEASGYRAGLYTSPHLVDLRERWIIGGRMIDDELLERSIEMLRKAAEAIAITPTYFEALTIVAFLALRLAEGDAAILEVGMGGRLDATNVVRPVAALITPIGFDHMEFLGNTMKKIAAEKAGVIHRGAVVLTSNRDPQVLAVLRRRAEKFDNPFHAVLDEVRVGDRERLETSGGVYHLRLPLVGAFQLENAALAIRAAEELSPRFPHIARKTIEHGLAMTRWRGRLEHVRARGKEIWIDGCHNPHAIAVIAPFIEQQIPPPRLLVFGIMADKQIAEVARKLFPLFDRVIATEPYPPRSEPAETLAEIARSMGIEAIAEREPRAAFARALSSPSRAIFVGGSLYLAGAAIEYFDALRQGMSHEQ